jgi:MFS family permease
LWVSWIKGFDWRYVFFSSACWCFLMLLPTLFIYKEPEKPEEAKAKPIKQVLNETMLVLSDSRFMLLILVYSCFWILYFQMFGSILWYLFDFINRSPVTAFMKKVPILRLFEFNVEFVTVINAGTIVLLVLIISRITKNMKAIPVMSAGIIFGSLGFVVLAFTYSPWMFIAGIAVFSIGEMTAHPKYYSYVGLVAPKDNVATYMGYAFLYGVFGSLFGSNLGAILYERMLKPLAPDPEKLAAGVVILEPNVLWKIKIFWLIFAVLGIVCLVGMLLYNKFFSEDSPETNRRAWKVMMGIYFILAVSGLYFFIHSLFLADQIQWRTLIQSLILIIMGGGGMRISLKRKP